MFIVEQLRGVRAIIEECASHRLFAIARLSIEFNALYRKHVILSILLQM